MAETERAHYVFTVKEYGDGTPWIMCEPSRDELKLLDHGFIGFDLPKGTTYERAQEIAQFLRRNITLLSYTSFDHSDLH